MYLFKLKNVALASAMACVYLSGCGGGGGGAADTAVVVPATTLSGTVAGGAAVIGTVLITDSKGSTKGAQIEANGHYTVDVSDMLGPFVLKAAGRVGNTTVTYYSAATAADIGGTVNVTPFTNLMVSNIAAQMAETYFSNPANIANIGTLITPAKLAAAETALQAKLAPVLTALGIDSSIDLLRSVFAADHSGMDAVLDLVKVEVDTASNIATLKNALTQMAIATDNTATSADDATAVDSSKMTGMTSGAVGDLQAIVTKLNGFAALFATALPSVTTLQNSGVFDTSASFMMSGESFAQFATEISTEPELVGLKFSNVAIALDAGGSSGTLTAMISSSSSALAENIDLKMVKVAGSWMIQGDGRISHASVTARAQRNEWTLIGNSSQSGSFMQSGIRFDIDPFAYNSSHVNAPVVRAVITGPGLANGAVTMVPDVQNTWFKLEGSTYSDNLVPECGTLNSNTQQVITTQCVHIAQALDNSKYTVVLKDSNNNSLNGAGYQLTLPKQPYFTSALTTALFPVINAVTIDGQPISVGNLQTNKSVAVSWTMPSGLLPRDVNIWANTSAGADYFRVEKSLSSTASSALLGLGTPSNPGTVTNFGVWLAGMDIYGREVTISRSTATQ